MAAKPAAKESEDDMKDAKKEGKQWKGMKPYTGNTKGKAGNFSAKAKSKKKGK